MFRMKVFQAEETAIGKSHEIGVCLAYFIKKKESSKVKMECLGKKIKEIIWVFNG